MKKALIISLLFMSLACTKNRRTGDACILLDLTTAVVDQTINASNCGSEFPTNYVETEIDWGDGTVTDGQTGSHAYSTPGTYTVRLFLNGEWAADATEADTEKVQIEITITE